MDDSGLPIRLPQKGEVGVDFLDWLDTRLAGNRLVRQRLVPFIQEWDLLRDEVIQRDGREPTLIEYGERWNVAESSAYRLLGEYREIFGTEYPGPLCELLWDGMPKFGAAGRQELVSLMRVKVVDA